MSGPVRIRLIATNIAGDGVPTTLSPLDQDYALVIVNGNEVAQAVIASAAQRLYLRALHR